MDSKDVLEEYNKMQSALKPYFQLIQLSHENELVLVTTSHLITEFLINFIIKQKCVNPDKIVEESRFTYSIKLNMIYSMKLLPEYLYENLDNLNRLRNSYTHNLNPKPIIKFFNLVLIDNSNNHFVIEKSEYVKQSDELWDSIEYHKFIKNMCINTLDTLAWYCILNLNIRIPFENISFYKGIIVL